MTDSNAKCRDLVCCHADDLNFKNNNSPSNTAGPYGHKDCDTPLSGLGDILSRINQTLTSQPNLIFVTGGVISDQLGLLTLEAHLTTLKQTYALIAETFPNSFVIPSIGSSDYYPQHYSNLNFSKNYTSHEWDPIDRYKRDNIAFINNVTAEFNKNYLNFANTTGMSIWGDFLLKNVPYDTIQS